MATEAFIQVLPIEAIHPKVGDDDSLIVLSLPGPGHYIFFVDENVISAESLLDSGKFLLPEGSRGGVVIRCHGSPKDAISVYKLKDA